MRHQKRTGKPRIQRSASFIERLNTKIDQTAKRFDVSRSFVIAVACGFALGIEEQEQLPKTTGRRRVLHFRKKHAA